MRIAVFGTGGVGGYFGGRLAEAGNEVHFIARGAHLEAIRRSGLVVHSFEGDVTIAPALATDTPEEVGIVDLVIVAVKAWQVEDAAEAMKPLVGEETMVLPLENGVEAADTLAAVLGRNHVLGGLCVVMSFIEGPGLIRHAAIHPVIRIGELDNTVTPRLERIRDTLAAAKGFTVEVPPDITAALWAKFIFIAPWSTVGAATRVTIGEILSLYEVRELLIGVMEEVVAVGRARGVAIPDSVVQHTIDFYDSVAPESAVSMQRDVMAGKPSELESQTGAVVRMGRVAGVPTPLSATLYTALLPLELASREAV